MEIFGTTGQERREWLDNALNNALRYYLGPTGIPERLNVLNEVLNPVVGMEQASLASQDMLRPGATWQDRVNAGGRMATEIAGVVAPAAALRFGGIDGDKAARALEEAFLGFSATPEAVAARDFGVDEAGAFDLYYKGGTPQAPGTLKNGENLRSISARYEVPAGSRPEYLGAAPDRSGHTYLRYQPKTTPVRVQEAVAALKDPQNAVRKQMLADVERGRSIGGDDWYNTEELRDWFIAEHGEETGDAMWRDAMMLMGTTSPGSKVDANLASMSAVRNRIATDPEYRAGLLGLESLDDAAALAKGRPTGYGHKTARNQELNTARYFQGQYGATPEPGVPAAKGSWTQNPKPKGFANSLLGSERNIAADLHFTRYMGMAADDPAWLANQVDTSLEVERDILSKYPDAAAYFKDRTVNGKRVPTFNPKKAVMDGVVPFDEVKTKPQLFAEKPNDAEYGALESLVADLAAEQGMTPAQFQANLWMGAADRTGVDPTSQGTFMELLRARAAKTGKKTGRSAAEVLHDFVSNYGLLSAGPAAFLGMSAQDLQAQAEQQNALRAAVGGMPRAE